MSTTRPHEDRLGTGGSTNTEVLTRSGTGIASWEEPTGGGGSGITLVPETPVGTIDGVNDTFTLSVAPDLLILFKNGLVQRVGAGNDYTLAGSTITYDAGNIPQVGDTHVAYLNDTVTGEILDHTTAETDTTLVLAPDGTGGVEFRAEAGGGGGSTLDLFGDGQDGDVIINSGTFSVSVGGSALITNNALVRDAYFDDLELNGGDLITAGFRVFVAGTLTMTSGVIRQNGQNGNNGGNGSAAAGGSAGGAIGGTAVGSTIGGVGGLAGTAGGFNAGAANPGVNSAPVNGRTQPLDGAAGGASGQGQAGGFRAGTATTNALVDRSFWVEMLRAIAARSYSNVQPSISQGMGTAVGGGGGGGAASSGGGGGGGSGGSGAYLVVVANIVTGTTDIQALGGNGGNGGNGGGTDAGGGGGGGGGMGGWITLVYRDKTGWSGTIDVSGGTGGTGGTGIGTGSAGGNGPNGNAGIAKEWQI